MVGNADHHVFRGLVDPSFKDRRLYEVWFLAKSTLAAMISMLICEGNIKANSIQYARGVKNKNRAGLIYDTQGSMSIWLSVFLTKVAVPRPFPGPHHCASVSAFLIVSN